MFGGGVCSSPSNKANGSLDDARFGRLRRSKRGFAAGEPMRAPLGPLPSPETCGAQAFCALAVGVAWITLCRRLFPN
jgi:hypothetical protein